MAALDLLGRRYALRIIWELRDGPLTFRELGARCGDLSPSSLNTRLRELRQADIAGLAESRHEPGYRLTRQGERLLEALQPLARWSQAWRPSSTAR